MHDDSVRYWQDLAENYRQMGDGELLELSEHPEDLTEVAQQVLRDEITKRRLDEPPAQPETAKINGPAAVHWESMTGPSPSSADEQSEGGDEEHEYTWKVMLAECDSQERAWQLSEALRRAGIENWIKRYNPFTQFETTGPSVLVAADQLEPARAIAALPIPQDIIEESQLKVPEFVLPTCPACGSTEDVVLESADPVNSWVCDACGAEWNDPEDPASSSAGT